MPTLQEIADRQGHAVVSTAGWIMPQMREPHAITLRIRSRAWIAEEANRRGLPRHTAGFTITAAEGHPPVVHVPPLNTVEDMELWRHELRHAIEGDWHGRDAPGDDSARGLTTRCEKRLQGVHPDLTRVIRRASRDASAPFLVTCGLRTKEDQARLVDLGKSRTMNSRHLTGHAVDLAAIEAGSVTWSWPAYEKLAGSVKRAALDEGVPIVWGGDWEFRDGPHFELPREHYPEQS